MTLRYASELGPSGYSVAAQRCLDALRAVGVDVTWEALVDLPEGRVPATSTTTATGEVLVLHSVPRGWARCREELQPGRLIGHTVWETERVPALWLVEMDPADELWVPTEWNRAAFADAFDKPVHVVPHVASTTMPEPPPLELRDGTFVVAVVAAWEWRKRPDRAIEAFLQAFGPQDDVALVVKTTAWPVAWPWRPDLPTVAHLARLVPEARRAQVHIDTGVWSEAQVLGLLERADCVLSLTASEGWGLPAFDAACLGTPVVITGFGGHLEWLGADHPGLLPHRMVPVDHPDLSHYEPGMRWGEADLDAAVDLLRDLAAGRADALGRATSALHRTLPERYAPARVGRLAAEALGRPEPDRRPAPARRALPGGADEQEPPIVVLSFDRPHYLERVLASLRAQSRPIRDARVHLFQDGALDRHDDVLLAPSAAIDACVRLFRAAFPGGQVHASPWNAGTAGNVFAAETFVFQELGAPLALFFEDDLELAPHYLQAMGAIWEAVRHEPRIGYFNAVGRHTASLEEQAAAVSSLGTMHQHWGFALRRDHWLRLAPFMARYHQLVLGRPYRRRPHEAIRDLFRSWGVPEWRTGQDGAKTAATLAVGGLLVSSGPCLGRYIGEVGFHSTPSIFEEGRWADTVLWTEPLPRPRAPAGEEIDQRIHDTVAGLRARQEVGA